MNKSIVISIRPEHALNILNGKKTLELRKSVPKDFVGWVYGYVTKWKDILCHFNNSYYDTLKDDNTLRIVEKVVKLNATIPFRFWFDGYEELFFVDSEDDYKLTYDYGIYYDYDEEIFEKLCLTKAKVNEYGKGKDLYAWHIKKLEVFDKPMMLGEFYTFNKDVENVGAFGWALEYDEFIPLKRPPQSYQFVWVKE